MLVVLGEHCKGSFVAVSPRPIFAVLLYVLCDVITVHCIELFVGLVRGFPLGQCSYGSLLFS